VNEREGNASRNLYTQDKERNGELKKNQTKDGVSDTKEGRKRGRSGLRNCWADTLWCSE